MGGVHPSFMPQESLKHCDAVVIGEVELVIDTLLDDLQRRQMRLAQRLERDAPGVSKSILEGLDEILTVSRLGLPPELRRSLACTNIIENMMGTVRRVTRNVKRWSSPSMALRWTAAAMHEAKKGFRRLKAFKQLPALRAALAAHYEKENHHAVAQKAKAA
jgi:putative transposase